MFGTYDDWKTRSDRDDEAGYWEADYSEDEPEQEGPELELQIYACRFANLNPIDEPEWHEQIVVTYYPDDVSHPLQYRRFFFPFKA